MDTLQVARELRFGEVIVRSLSWKVPGNLENHIQTAQYVTPIYSTDKICGY